MLLLLLLVQLCILTHVRGLLDAVDPRTLQHELTTLRSQVAAMAVQMMTLQQTIITMQGELSMLLVSFLSFLDDLRILVMTILKSQGPSTPLGFTRKLLLI